MAGALTAAIAAAFAGGVTPDPYFEYTTLLLPGSGTNGAQNNTFLDGSTNNFTITRNGNTTQGTFSPFSQTGWGNYFNGSSYLTVSDNAAFTLGNSDFCIELWINSSSSMGGYAGFFGQWANATTNCSYIFRTQASQIVQFGYTTTGNAQTGTTVDGSALTTNSWNHLVVCRSGANLAIFQNGTRTATHNISTLTIADSTRDMQIGYSTDGGYVLGYMSNLRLVKGSSVYDPTQTTITVPTAPLTAITNTSILTCQSNRFKDNSTNAFTLTASGSPTVVAFSPFNPTASWSAATYGGSGYFDGNGDYLTAPSNAAFAVGSVFTIEFWLYPISAGANPVYIYLNENTGSLQFGLNGGTLSLAAAGVAWRLTGSKGPVTNAWNHCVLVRSGTGANQTSIFLNGERIANGTVTDAWTTDVQAIIQSTLGTSYLTTGYMSGIRIVKGTAVYDPTLTTLTVPTAPLTAITNTSLLLNCTNAGIYDATSKNDLETVADAQISNTTAKWGSTSIKFDGTGDYLTNNNASNSLLAFGTGDFTIEGWFYSNNASSAVQKGMFQTSDTIGGLKTSYTTGVSMNHGSTGELSVNVGSTVYTTSGASITTGAWFYFAITRSSGNVNVYVNGVSRASGSGNTNNLTGTYISVGGYYNTSYLFDGYLQDFRITKGYARTITTPTAAFPTL
jgi:hypothetical protein